MLKRNTIKAFIKTALLCLPFFACGNLSDLSIPENVSVKSGARYSVAFGEKYYNLKDKVGGKLEGGLTTGTGGAVYTYVPGEDDGELQYLMHKTVFEIPLSASQITNLTGGTPVDVSVSNSPSVNGFSKSKMLEGMDEKFSDLVSRMEFESVPVYFYVKGEGVLNFNVKLSYAGAGGTSEYIIGASGNYATLDGFDAEPAWPAHSSTYTENWETLKNSNTGKIFYKDMASVINSSQDSISFSYDIKIPTDTTVSSFSIEMVAVLPMKFKITDATTFDFYDATGIEHKDDLLEREDASSIDDYSKFEGCIKSLRIDYNMSNSALRITPETGSQISLKVDDTGRSDVIKTVDISISDTASQNEGIDFTKDEISKILTNKFSPEMNLTIPKGEILFLRKMLNSEKSFGVNPKMTLQLDPESPFVITDIIK